MSEPLEVNPLIPSGPPSVRVRVLFAWVEKKSKKIPGSHLSSIRTERIFDCAGTRDDETQEWEPSE